MNTTEFLEEVRDLSQHSATDEDWTDTKILYEGTQALCERFTQTIVDIRHGYWLKRVSVSTSNGVKLYRIPNRAVVQGLEKVDWTADGQRYLPLSILTDIETNDYENAQPGDPRWFSLEGDYLRLFPTPNRAVTLRFTYYLRPSKLVTTVSTGLVVAAAGTQIAVSGDPSAYLTGTTFDVVNTTGCNEVAVVDMPLDSIVSLGFGAWGVNVPAGTDLTYVAQGQVLRASDQTDQIPLPRELQPALSARVAAVMLTARGDFQKAEQLNGKAENTIKRVTDLAIPRIKTRPYSIKTKNTYMRRRVGFGFNWR